MAFISYEQKEDMQDDTFKMIASLIYDAIRSYRDKDVESLFSDIDTIYTTLHVYTESQVPDGFNDRVDELRKKLYSDSVDHSPEAMSRHFEEARKLWRDLAGALTKGGLMLRARVDKSELVTL